MGAPGRWRRNQELTGVGGGQGHGALSPMFTDGRDMAGCAWELRTGAQNGQD
jgi:hypothetical protein